MSDNSGVQMGINYVRTVGVLQTPWEPMGDTGTWEKSRGASWRAAPVSRDANNRSQRQRAPRTGQDYRSTCEA